MNAVPARDGATEESAPRPLHNAALLTAASFAAKGCGFVALLVSTHVLGTVGMGYYTTVMNAVGLFSVATDLGLTTLAVRDVAQNRALLPRYAGNVLTLRVILSLATAASCIALAFALASGLHYGPTVLAGIVLWALALVPTAVTGAAGVVFQAIERMAPISIITTATAALTAILGSATLLLGGRVVALVAVMAAVNAAAAIAALVLAARVVPMRPRLELSWWPALVRAALPFAVLTLLNVLYSRADGLMVYTMKGAADAGLYAVAYRLVDTLLTLIISPFNAAVLPAFNRVGAGSREALHRLVVPGVRIMLALGVPVAVAASLYPQTVLGIFGGQYPSAAPALVWLAWSFPCFTVLAILYNALYAVRRANAVAITFGVTLLFNVGLNLLLIPRYGYFASAALTTASEALNVALAGWAVRRHVGPIAVWGAAARIALAGLVMALVMAALRPLGIVVGLPAGALAYLLAIRLARALGAAEGVILARLPLLGRYAVWLVARD